MGLQFEEWRCCHERGIPKALEGFTVWKMVSSSWRCNPELLVGSTDLALFWFVSGLLRVPKCSTSCWSHKKVFPSVVPLFPLVVCTAILCVFFQATFRYTSAAGVRGVP